MFVGLGPLVLLGLIVAVAFVVTHVSHGRRRDDEPPSRLPRLPSEPASPSSTADLALGNFVEQAALDRWVDAGLLTSPQASAIAEFEQRRTQPTSARSPETPAVRRRIPAVAEALGYLGGILAAVGLVMALAQFWRDMSTGGRLGLSAAGAAGLLVAGAIVREDADPALGRLRGFVWFAATSAVGLVAGVVAQDVLDANAPKSVVLAVSAAVAVCGAVLWFWRERPLQEASCFVGAIVLVGTLVAAFADEGPIGLAVWLAGAVLMGVGVFRRVPLPIIAKGIGAAATITAGVIASYAWPGFGFLLALCSAAVIVALAAFRSVESDRSDRVLFTVVGGLGLLQMVPVTLAHFSDQTGGVAGLITSGVGATVVAVGWRRLVRNPTLTKLAGGLVLVGGAALTVTQWEGFAPLFGLATGIALITLGTAPNQVILSVVGSVGMLINVPWAIGYFFPGEGRAPRLILAAGVVIVAVAVLLTRQGGRFRNELDPGRTSVTNVH